MSAEDVGPDEGGHGPESSSDGGGAQKANTSPTGRVLRRTSEFDRGQETPIGRERRGEMRAIASVSQTCSTGDLEREDTGVGVDSAPPRATRASDAARPSHTTTRGDQSSRLEARSAREVSISPLRAI